MRREFETSLDLKSKLITVFVAVLFVSIGYMNSKSINFHGGDDTKNWAMIGSMGLMVLIFVFCYLYRPVKYTVTNSEIIVNRLVGDLIIKIKDLKNVLIPNEDSMKWTMRTFGNGGLFGYYGRFRNSTYGSMTWYATRTSNYIILIKKDGDKIVLTPDDLSIAELIRERLDKSVIPN